MGQEEKKIAKLIDAIAHKRDDVLRYTVMSGKVKRVNTADMTAEVELSADDPDAPTDGISLNVVLNNMAGAYAIPTDGAYCIVAEVDGPGKWELLKASAYDGIYLKSATLTQLNDGSYGGIPIVGKVKDNDKAIRDYIKNTLELKIHDAISAVGVGSSADGPTAATSFTASLADKDISFEDMENTRVTHGK